MQSLPDSANERKCFMTGGRKTEKEQTMLGIFNRTIRNATQLDDWRAPDHWKHQLHQSTYHRQQSKADEHRVRLARDIGFWR